MIFERAVVDAVLASASRYHEAFAGKFASLHASFTKEVKPSVLTVEIDLTDNDKGPYVLEQKPNHRVVVTRAEFTEEKLWYKYKCEHVFAIETPTPAQTKHENITPNDKSIPIFLAQEDAEIRSQTIHFYSNGVKETFMTSCVDVTPPPPPQCPIQIQDILPCSAGRPPRGRLPETMDELYGNYYRVAFAFAMLTLFVCFAIGSNLWEKAYNRREKAHKDEMNRRKSAHHKKMDDLIKEVKQRDDERQERIDEIYETANKQREEHHKLMEELMNEHHRKMEAFVKHDMLAAYFLIFGILMEEVEEDPIATQTKLRKSLCKFHPDKKGGNAKKFQQVKPIYQQLMSELEPRVHKARAARAEEEAKRARMEHLEALNMPRSLLLTFDDAFAQEGRKEHLETVNIAPLLVAHRNRCPHQAYTIGFGMMCSAVTCAEHFE